ncbi:restriction endonuclease [Pantoea agglomerans]|uniref:nSTAND3 domain-containing NTPase n=1 Tax=Enterobacter agglomerans TaxID=549 RepID=UPI003DA19C80
MNDYDFKSLNDKEFEVLAIDLISKREDCLFERFKPGRDGGIDGRFHKNGDIIIQVKHYATTGYDGLISKLKKEEVAKVKKLNPSRYVFVTSVALSPANKNEIKTIFSPYILDSSDIIGKEGLNDLLKKHPQVEKTHFKLWLSSSNILISLLNNGINQKSEYLVEESLKDSYKFIKTQQFDRAVSMLSNNNALIITGLPGVGKTTLAKQLMLWYASLDYQVYHIEESITEVEAAILKGVKQFFYFDDFLGSNYLQIFTANSDSKIVNFIKRVISDPTKKIILTSRTNILNKAKNLSEVFNLEKVGKKEFEINVSELSVVEKAHILYNQMWHGLKSAELANVFYKDKNYWKIINHKNFNPRIISFITDLDRVKNYDISDYWEYIEDALDNPAFVWEKCFDNQTPDELFDLVSLIVLNGNSIIESTCKNALRQVFFIKYSSQYHVKSNKIDSLIIESLRSTVNRSIINDKKNPAKSQVTMLTPFNPSISDYLLNRLARNLDALTLYFSALNTRSSIDTIFSIYYNDKIDFEILKSILLSLAEKINSVGLNDYAIHFYGAITCSNLDESIQIELINTELFKNIDVLSLNYSPYLAECVIWVRTRHPSLFPHEFYIDLIECALQTDSYSTLEHEDYLLLTKVIRTCPGIMQNPNASLLKNAIKAYWHDNAQDLVVNSIRMNEIYDNQDLAYDIAYEIIHEHVDEYQLDYEDEDFEYMKWNFNADEIFKSEDYEEYNGNEAADFYNDYIEARDNAAAYIDDLFTK